MKHPLSWSERPLTLCLQATNAAAAKAKVAELRKGSFQAFSEDIESKMKAAQAAKKTVDMTDW